MVEFLKSIKSSEKLPSVDAYIDEETLLPSDEVRNLALEAILFVEHYTGIPDLRHLLTKELDQVVIMSLDAAERLFPSVFFENHDHLLETACHRFFSVPELSLILLGHLLNHARLLHEKKDPQENTDRFRSLIYSFFKGEKLFSPIYVEHLRQQANAFLEEILELFTSDFHEVFQRDKRGADLAVQRVLQEKADQYRALVHQDDPQQCHVIPLNEVKECLKFLDKKKQNCYRDARLAKGQSVTLMNKLALEMLKFFREINSTSSPLPESPKD